MSVEAPARRSVFVVLATVVALVGVAVILFGDDDRAPTKRSEGVAGQQAGGDAALSPEGRELAELLGKGLSGTYHARYQSSMADPRSAGTQVVMDIWRKGALGRQEVAVQAQGARSRTATFLLPPQAVECSQVGEKPWSCKPPTEAPSPEPPEVQVRKTLAFAAITARDERIAGLPVRCFTYPAAADIDETCLLRDGVLARMVTSSSRFDLIALSANVPDEVFALPAQS